MENENFITIMGWMVNKLKLKDKELIVYASIYAFSQTEDQFFEASLSYIADWISCSKQSVINCIKSLLEKGFIYRIEYKDKGNVRYKYHHNPEVVKNFDWSNNLTGVVKNFDQEAVKNFDRGSQNFLPNKYISNNTDNNNDNNKEKEILKKKKYGEYKNVVLSDDELKKLQEEFADWKERIERVSSYCASTGKNYKNYLATIRNWARREKAEQTGKETPKNSGSFNTDEFLEAAKRQRV